MRIGAARSLIAGLLLSQVPAVAAQSTSEQPTPAPSQERLVPVDGSTMALHISGSGKVAIILEAGGGGDHRSWSVLQPQLNSLGRVVSYDRLGYGHSGRSERPRSARVVAEQLHEGLTRAGINPPFLLVGHSYGGAIARVFASKYPNEVIGLVLVDPALEDFYTTATLQAPEAYLKALEDSIVDDDKADSETYKRELLAYETSMLETRLAEPPKGERIILISASRQLQQYGLLNRIWLEEHARWTQRVGARRIVVDAGHQIQRTNPDVVVSAVKALLNSPKR